MKKIYALIIVLTVLLSACEIQVETNVNNTPDREDYVLVIHGGAGAISRDQMTDEQEKAYHDKLNEALNSGEEILKSGGEALDAVIAAIQVMEECPLFNAGRGAVMTNEQTCELDASLMNGADLNAGAVAGVKTIKSPIEAARMVMDSSKHVMLIGDGAEYFAKEIGLEMVSNEYFYTDKRLEQIKRIKKEYGTVGCVAMDKNGNLAAGTSTGGMTNKKWGRVGDSPIIGAGTYADNKSCAVSATGHGEYFIRNAVAYDVCAQYFYGKIPLQEAVDNIIHKKFENPHVNGGLIAIDKNGDIAAEFNTSGMFRGWVKASGERTTMIYK
jgi:beta-aspartyl-peptidase (threonine type)